MRNASTRQRALIGASGFIVVAAVAAALVINDGAGDTDTTTSEDSLSAVTTVSDAADDPQAAQQAVTEHRRALRLPALSAQSSLSSLRSLTADAIVGGDDTDDLRSDIANRSDDLTNIAGELETAAAALEDDPAATGEAEIDDAAARLVTLREHGPDVAETLRDAVEETEALTDAAIELQSAAKQYSNAAEDLPQDADIDVLLEDWRQERDRLNDYHSAANAASDHEPLAQHARAHRALIAELADFADAAIEDLEADNLDAYNDRLNSHRDELDTLIEDVARSLEPALDASVNVIEQAENRTLGLLAELDQIRDGLVVL